MVDNTTEEPRSFNVPMTSADGENLLKLLDVACRAEGLSVAGFASYMASKIQTHAALADKAEASGT